MSRFENKMNSIGALLAVLISLVALAHTIWSKQQLRECDFLYSQSGRLIEVIQTINQADTNLMSIRTEAKSVVQENDDDRKRVVVTAYIAQLLNSSQEIYNLLNLYQYAFSDEDVDKIRTMIKEIENVQNQHQSNAISTDQFFSMTLEKGMGLFDLMKNVSDSELSEVSGRLRDTCK